MSAPPKPSPCSKPNANTSSGRRQWNPRVAMFSMATATIDSAISGSTIDARASTAPVATSASVSACATVNALTCHASAVSDAADRNSPATNKA